MTTSQDKTILQQLDLPNHPERFVTDILGEKIWDRQTEILHGAFNYRQLLVQSGNSTGKTWIAARLVLAFLFSFSKIYGYKGQTKVIIVGPKFEQLRKQIWAELGAAVYNSRFPLGGTLQAHDYVIAPGWYAGIFAVDKESPEKVQGYHAENFLAIIEEATGVPDSVEEAIKSCATSANSHIVCLCNPIRLSGWMYEACTAPNNIDMEASGIRKVIKMSCQETPNYVARKEIIPGLATYDWVEEKRHEWGESSPMWQARILGEWPRQSDTALITLEDFEDACSEERLKAIQADESRKAVALDIARAGEDQSVVIGISGDVVDLIRAATIRNTMKCVYWFKEAYLDHGGIPVIDENGLGGGPYDKLRYEEHVPVRGFVSQRKAEDAVSERFANIKAQAAWELRERFRNGTIAIAPNRHIDRLRNDLTGYEVVYDMRGRLKLVDPERSPDFGDALIMAHWGQAGGNLEGNVVVGGKTCAAEIERAY